MATSRLAAKWAFRCVHSQLMHVGFAPCFAVLLCAAPPHSSPPLAALLRADLTCCWCNIALWLLSVQVMRWPDQFGVSRTQSEVVVHKCSLTRPSSLARKSPAGGTPLDQGNVLLAIAIVGGRRSSSVVARVGPGRCALRPLAGRSVAPLLGESVCERRRLLRVSTCGVDLGRYVMALNSIWARQAAHHHTHTYHTAYTHPPGSPSATRQTRARGAAPRLRCCQRAATGRRELAGGCLA